MNSHLPISYGQDSWASSMALIGSRPAIIRVRSAAAPRPVEWWPRMRIRRSPPRFTTSSSTGRQTIPTDSRAYGTSGKNSTSPPVRSRRLQNAWRSSKDSLGALMRIGATDREVASLIVTGVI